MAIIVGLTGGIGSGKSTILDFIQSKGYHIYNTDKAGKSILEKKEVVKKIINIFGIDVVGINDNIDTKKLASIVFKEKDKLALLNDIIHPEVAKDFNEKVQTLKDNELIIKESAILFESGSHKKCDYTILITAPKEIRINRTMKRDNISREKVLERMHNQWSDEEKSKMADFIVENIDQNKAFEEVEKTLKQIIVLGKK